MIYTFIPIGSGRVFNKVTNKPMKGVWVTFKFVGDSYKHYIPGGHGFSDRCFGSSVTRANDKGVYSIGNIPFYHSIRFLKEHIQVQAYYPGYRETKSKYPQVVNQGDNNLFLTQNNQHADDRLLGLSEIAERNLCGRPAWNKTSLQFYQELYKEAESLINIATGPYRFQYLNRICNVAIGDKRNEPRSGPCPWP